MKFIDKTQSLEPVKFTDWKTYNATIIDEKIADQNLNGTKVWESIPSDIKEILREQLVQDQHGICCYCGTRILPNPNTPIEHLQPKSIHRALVFDYTNLAASCSGGQKNIVHIVQPDETIEQLAVDYGVSVEHLEEIYVNTNFVQEKYLKLYDLENLKVGDRIIIFKKVVEKAQHCDCRKGQQEIKILPTQRDCASFFSYDKRSGKIKVTAENKSTIDILGLNDNHYLVRNREKEIERGLLMLNQLKNRFHSDKITFFKMLKVAQNKAMQLDENRFLKPYCFVYLSILQGK